MAQAFSELIAGIQATPDQIEFIELIVSELTTNGVMEAGRLYESPFLDISPQGPEGLFPVAKVDRMVQVLDEIWQRAAGRGIVEAAGVRVVPVVDCGDARGKRTDCASTNGPVAPAGADPDKNRAAGLYSLHRGWPRLPPRRRRA